MDPLLRTFGLELSTFFVVGLLAELHCLGMCGPLVSTFAAQGNQQHPDRISWNRLRRHFGYHGSRIGSYALLGGVFGLLGGTLLGAEDLAEPFRLVRGSVGLVAGLLIGLYGLSYVLRGSTVSAVDRVFGRVGGRLFRWVKSFFSPGRDDPGSNPSELRGSLHALLPCPILYPAFLYVLARGSATFGFLAMTTLGIGTLPLLFLHGVFSEGSLRGYPSIVHRLLGVLLVILAYVTLSMGLRNLGVAVPGPELPFYQPFNP